MARISIDNGKSFVTASEALQDVSLKQIAQFMNDDIREHVHEELAPCAEEEFLKRYLELVHEDLIIG